MKLPPVEQHRFAPPSQQQDSATRACVHRSPSRARRPAGTRRATRSRSTRAAQRRPIAATGRRCVACSSAGRLQGRVICRLSARAAAASAMTASTSPPHQGAPIRASASGTVSYCGNELKGYGNLVLISHDNGYITAYAHVGSFIVSRDDRVVAGQVIAYAGATGDVTSAAAPLRNSQRRARARSRDRSCPGRSSSPRTRRNRPHIWTARCCLCPLNPCFATVAKGAAKL